MTYTLYGGPASLYTGKARSYLRKQSIDFVELSPGSDRYLNELVPVLGRWIIPVMETPDGQIIQDGADIIDHFERGNGESLVKYPAYPETPAHLAVSHLFEIFGGEGLLRPAMHFRWNFDDENLDFLRAEFGVLMSPSMTTEQKAQEFDRNSGRMRKAAVSFGVSPETAPLIEEAFVQWLDLFSAHLEEHPFLLGGRPTIGDYGLMAAMWAHLFRDPVPQSLIKQRTPLVGRWVERMATSEPYLHDYPDANDLIADDAIPSTLEAMMHFVAEEWLGEITAHVAYANEWLGERPDLIEGTNGLKNPGDRSIGSTTFSWRGVDITTNVLPYRFWLLQRLQDDVAAAGEAEQARVRTLFASAGLESLLDLRTLRRVERVDNLEVWGSSV